jgi:hypothetical protein
MAEILIISHFPIIRFAGVKHQQMNQGILSRHEVAGPVILHFIAVSAINTRSCFFSSSPQLFRFLQHKTGKKEVQCNQ